MAEVFDYETGAPMTAGLQGCKVCDEALIAARNIAKDHGKPVLLVDDDGEWIVQPNGDCAAA